MQKNMMRQWIVGASLIGLTAVLSGCGGGGGGDPTPAPTGPPGPAGPTAPPAGKCACPKSRNFAHCTACSSDGSAISCTACSGSYTPNSAATDRKDPDQVCITKCSAPGATPARPANAQGNNGVTWPTLCQDDTSEAVFFGIGDWGGMCGWNGKKCEKGKPNLDCTYKYGDAALPGMPCTFPLRPPQIKEIEGHVQKKISDRMAERNDILTKAGTPPQYILNVGDNFYPGGIDVHCGNTDVEDHTKNQFEMVWKQVYPGELTERMEWWGVLGNHDYGGVCYVKGWDQQVMYTYDPEGAKWMVPGQYWMRSVQYKNMKIDFFFVEGSWADTKDGGGGQDIKHDICQYGQGGTGRFCENEYYPGSGADCAATGPHNGGDCENWFRSMWGAQYKWLMDKVPNSDADWQIVVTHYPGSSGLGHAGQDRIDWREWGPKMGLDLIISGHKHYQRVYKGAIPGEGGIEIWDKGTVSVITGGGGGITTDNPGPISRVGQDFSYGFVEFHATLEEIKITLYSHGGVDNKLIAMNTSTVQPVEKKSDDEIIKAGLDPQNLLRKQAITV